MKHRAGATCDPHIPRLENLERHDRHVDQVPHLMSEESEALTSPCGLSIDAGLISFALILGDRAGDGLIVRPSREERIL